MAESLQDQLRSLGLAREKPKKKRRRPTGKKPRPAGSSDQGPQGEPSLEQAWALKERDEKQKAEKARRDKQAEHLRRRRINSEIRRIVEKHRRNRDDADIPRHFHYKGRIRKLHVTAEQQQALSAGELGIVYLTGGYHLLPIGQVEAVRKLSPGHVPDLAGGEGDDGDHPVPDDLVW